MKVRIIYDSKFGSNIKVAEYMKELLSESHNVAVSYAKDISPQQVLKESPDALLFGGPLRMGNLSRTIRKWAQKFAKSAEKQGYTLQRLGAWETKSFVSEEDKNNAEGMEKKLLDKMENTPDVLKGLMKAIPLEGDVAEPLSLYIIMPPNDEMSEGKLEEGYQEKVQGFLSKIFD